MKTMHFDILIVGAGPGGYRAAEHAARHGLSVAVFEPSQLGGTCLNAGCIPTKSFARNAEVLQTLHEGALYGLQNLQYEVDFSAVVARKEQVTSTLRSGIEGLLAHPNITLVRAEASFKDEKTITADGQDYTADHILLATGSTSKMLRLNEPLGRRVLEAADLLSGTTLPKSLCIIGAGVIGMEFASIYNAFGVEVTVVEYLKECLPVLDSDIAKRLRKTLEKKGVTFCMQSSVTGITEEGVHYLDKKGLSHVVSSEEVLMAVGRAPRTEGLCLEKAGIEPDSRGAIPVNSQLQVVLPDGSVATHLYAIGDVNGLQMLAHAAEMQGLKVVNDILGKPHQIRLDIMPAAIFTQPEAACVGLSEDQCKESGLAYACRKAFWRANGKALAMNESEGMLKLLCSEQGEILGCHAFGAHAADIVQEASVLMCRKTTVEELADMVHIHPTLSEILKSAAE